MGGHKCRILFMLSITFIFFLIELIVGYATNAMSLVADAFHMLSDLIALFVAYISIRLSPKKWSRNTFGLARAEVLGALVNSVFLLALCFSIFVESIQTLFKPELMDEPVLVLIIGALGLVINIIGIILFREGSNMGCENQIEDPSSTNGKKSNQMNMRGVFLHLLADALGSVIVVISAIIVLTVDWKYKVYIDPILSIIMVFIIAHSTLPLASESSLILLQTVPTSIDVTSLNAKLEKIDGVLAVHELHVWQLTCDRIIASAHILCRDIYDYMIIADRVKELFHNEGIHSTTIQPEFINLPINEHDEKRLKKCNIFCPPNENGSRAICYHQTCCNSSGSSNGSTNESPDNSKSSEENTINQQIKKTE